MAATPRGNRAAGFATLVDYVAPGMLHQDDGNLIAHQFRTRIAALYLRRTP
ncbi:hypothetical protein [Corynebacterium guangdongense]|uniref:Uncharacterized protein n=1 Tax=Corynebacterium guangdongense TaxID=1783348 RepID=A0ABU1ZWY3_9CORY|nr:hypothetical protein [Corynebacterium guangdongense]MDR7329444.1 hypothetical protein [Corynebacterium guangdongense]WJZ18009.1 hypothetical protein CGUA_07200 [Corynebacterium guangdongense]